MSVTECLPTCALFINRPGYQLGIDYIVAPFQACDPKEPELSLDTWKAISKKIRLNVPTRPARYYRNSPTIHINAPKPEKDYYVYLHRLIISATKIWLRYNRGIKPLHSTPSFKPYKAKYKSNAIWDEEIRRWLLWLSHQEEAYKYAHRPNDPAWIFEQNTNRGGYIHGELYYFRVIVPVWHRYISLHKRTKPGPSGYSAQAGRRVAICPGIDGRECNGVVKIDKPYYDDNDFYHTGQGYRYCEVCGLMSKSEPVLEEFETRYDFERDINIEYLPKLSPVRLRIWQEKILKGGFNYSDAKPASERMIDRVLQDEDLDNNFSYYAESSAVLGTEGFAYTVDDYGSVTFDTRKGYGDPYELHDAEYELCHTKPDGTWTNDTRDETILNRYAQDRLEKGGIDYQANKVLNPSHQRGKVHHPKKLTNPKSINNKKRLNKKAEILEELSFPRVAFDLDPNGFDLIVVELSRDQINEIRLKEGKSPIVDKRPNKLCLNGDKAKWIGDIKPEFYNLSATGKKRKGGKIKTKKSRPKAKP